MNQQFWKNHLEQDTLPSHAPPTSRLASFGERSLSAPSSREGDGGGELMRKYMPAGQKVSGGGALIDDTTGLVNLNQQPAGGVWSLMVDSSGVPTEPVRRMRSQAQYQQQTIDPEEQRLAEKMRWNPQVEAQQAAKREHQAQKWENSTSALPGQNVQQDTGRSRRAVEHAPTSISWNDPPPQQQVAPPTDRSTAAPWMQEDNNTGRSSRRTVGVDHNKSKVSWGGYGNNDPAQAVNEPIGVMREADNDCFAIGNSRSEKYILKSGRIRGGAQAVQKDSVNLRDDAFTNDPSFRPSVAQVSPNSKGFFNVNSHGMANPNETEEWAPSGQPRRAPQGLERSEGMAAMDHMGRPIHQAPPPKPYQPPQQQPSPQLQTRPPLQPVPPLRAPVPAPWGMNYEQSNSQSSVQAQHKTVSPFDCEGVAVPTNIHFHVLDTTQSHPPPQNIPGQPMFPAQPPKNVSHIREAGQNSPRGYAKMGPGFGHAPLPNQQPYSQQQQPPNSQQQPYSQQQQPPPPQQPYNNDASDHVDFSNLSREDSIIVDDFVGWYSSTYGDNPPQALVTRALQDARQRRANEATVAMPPDPTGGFNHPRLSPMQSPRKSARNDGGAPWGGPSPSDSEKKMGGRNFAMGGGGDQTMNQGNSILGRRSTRVAAPPGGTSSFSLGGF